MPTYYSSSSSQSYQSSSTQDGQTTMQSFSKQVQSNPDGTSVRTAYQDNNNPVQYSDRQYTSDGRLVSSNSQGASRRIEDVSDGDADRRYKEAMKDEYAKREGGS
ncbi:hypothetical protein B0J13DRAFT_564813 [Dactylonectria estremocensis]|uniref:Uncharacterized protein n=1 Tax=Dactylonectria estremocensis TaxID=1079267 RepID=A0A9P9DZE4_9HYPO|nr:hypothetical protein B0J13DRAFT_564813 [Dactylonectria estremocensis]